MASRDLLSPNSITQLFDPNNIEHLKAFQHLSTTGQWPVNFLESLHPNVILPSGWSMLLQAKMADAWIDHKLQEKINKDELHKLGGLPVPKGRVSR